MIKRGSSLLTGTKLYSSPEHNIIREYRLTSYKPNSRNYW